MLIADARKVISSADQKLEYNRNLFNVAAPEYDIVTRCLSLGCDQRWKASLVRSLPPRLSNGRCVDLACGTGDLAFRLKSRYPSSEVIGIDATESMLAVARRRDASGSVRLLNADMCHTGLESSSVDVVTGGYALRNAPQLSAVLEEIFRILKPGGVAMFLDFAKPDSAMSQKLQYGLLKSWGAFCSLLVHRNPRVHTYIADSLSQFPPASQLGCRFEFSGLEVVRQRRLFMGMMLIIEVQKPVAAE